MGSGINGCYNVAYCYLPFVLEGEEPPRDAYRSVVSSLDSSESWCEIHDDIRYLFRYICEKYDSGSPNCQCRHYALGEKALTSFGLGPSSAWTHGRNWGIRKRIEQGGTADVHVMIDQVHCYAFSTAVNIMAVRLHVIGVDIEALASWMFNLKNVRNGSIVPVEGEPAAPQLAPEAQTARGMTLLHLARWIYGQTGLAGSPHFFFYANEGRERANLLVHAEVRESDPGEADSQRLLFYLANAYHQGFDYDPQRSLAVRSYWATPATLWGCSSEALACLTLPTRSLQGEGFLMSVFRRNVLNEYQFLYLLLLHQKYAYYRLLTNIGAGERRDRAQLEEFRLELELFKTNFVFSRVSETQQYQTLYEMVYRQLKLADMEQDVAEPVERLAQLRQEDDDRAEREGERRVERAMNMVACLAGISAVCDGLALINSYLTGVLPKMMLDVLSLAVAIALFVVTGRAARDLMRSGPEG